MKLTDLIQDLDYVNIHGSTDIEVGNIHYDSRNVSEGDLFVAIRGTESDGHEFMESAISFGARVIVCEECPPHKYDNLCVIEVKNSRKALAKLSANYYGRPTESLKVIGVTGTNGKTSVTFLIKNLLSQQNRKAAIIGTTGIYIGDEKLDASLTTPDPISLNKIMRDTADRGIEFVVMEVSSHALSQNRADFIDFDAAIFTNLTHDHLDYHKTFESYSEAKKKLFDDLKENAIAVVNVDDAGYKEMVSDTKAEVILVGWDVNAEYQIKNESFDQFGSRFDLEFEETNYNVVSPLMARFNIINLTLSLVTVSRLLGIDMDLLCADLSELTTAPGRMERVELRNGAIAIIDYAHTPDALEKAGRACRTMIADKDARLITVFGCGGDRDKKKRPRMAEAAEKYADRVIITDDNPRTENRDKIFENIEKGMKKAGNYVVIKDRAKAIEEAVRIANKGDIILIAGKGHENYQIIGTKKIHFDDKEVVTSI